MSEVRALRLLVVHRESLEAGIAAGEGRATCSQRTGAEARLSRGEAGAGALDSPGANDSHRPVEARGLGTEGERGSLMCRSMNPRAKPD